MIAGYLGKSDEFDQAIGDYAVFVGAIKDGRLKTALQLETVIK